MSFFKVNKNMKIAFLDLEGKGDIGGGQRGLIDILKYINRDLFEPIIFCPGNSDIFNKLINKNEKVFPFLPTRSKFLSRNQLPYISIISLIKLILILRKQKISLIVGNSFYSSKYGSLAALFLKLPSIMMIRCIYDNPFLGFFVAKRIIKNSTFVISNSFKAANIFKLIVKNNKHILTIQNGMDLKSLNVNTLNRDYIINKYNLANNIKIVGMVAMFNQQKGHALFVEAAELVVKKIKNIKFVLVGSDFNDELVFNDIQNLVKQKGLQHYFIFTGFVNNVRNYIASFDVSVLLSQENEGLPRAIMESMSLGKPVIGTNVGGISELIKDGVNGYLVKTKSINKLVNKLLYLLQHNLIAAEMGKSGRCIIESDFSLLDRIKDFEDIYKRAVNTK